MRAGIGRWHTGPDRRTLRRPAIPEVKPSDAFPTNLLVELPFPSSLDVIDKLLFAYLDQEKVPASAIFVLDTSGSMGFGSKGVTKLEYARRIAATLGYLARQQGDAGEVSEHSPVRLQWIIREL